MTPIKVETPQEHGKEVTKGSKVKMNWSDLNLFKVGESFFFEGVNVKSLALGMQYVQKFSGYTYKWKKHSHETKDGTLITRTK